MLEISGGITGVGKLPILLLVLWPSSSPLKVDEKKTHLIFLLIKLRRDLCQRDLMMNLLSSPGGVVAAGAACNSKSRISKRCNSICRCSAVKLQRSSRCCSAHVQVVCRSASCSSC
ncbi:hypothetical protein TNCT_540981 [Trichonephila clavata]|uniref:Secreted protein n=1 Tax=Trichonephila clavata TaxID=2740835 RepID=A0A8X6GHM8_TRICU|nr:hypothetical protein TNCT_540981 [Trichonephila clavata]